MNHAISRSVITPPTQGWWRCSVVFQQPAKGRTTNHLPEFERKTRIDSISGSALVCSWRYLT